MAILRLDSEQLSFYMTKKGMIHVRDTYAECRADITMCGRPLEKLTPMAERVVSDEHLCQRCGDSLVSEKKWGGLHIGMHRNRWSIVQPVAAQA